MDRMGRRKPTADVKLWTFRAGQFELLDTLQPSASTLAVSGRLMRFGGFQIWLCTKTSPPKQVVYHHFAFSNGLLEG